jgi:hypothetical protein
MYQLFLSLIIVGGLLFFTVLAFYTRKHLHRKSESLVDRSNVESIGYRNPSRSLPETKKLEPSQETNISYSPAETSIKIKNKYLPVIKTDEMIPGLSPRDLIHYLGSGSLYTIETSQGPEELVIEELVINEEELTPLGGGKLLLSSRFLLVYDNSFKKKILLSSIDKYHFKDCYLIFKRKRVKKKLDVLKIDDRSVEFKYILNTLI